LFQNGTNDSSLNDMSSFCRRRSKNSEKS